MNPATLKARAEVKAQLDAQLARRELLREATDRAARAFRDYVTRRLAEKAEEG